MSTKPWTGPHAHRWRYYTASTTAATADVDTARVWHCEICGRSWKSVFDYACRLHGEKEQNEA